MARNETISRLRSHIPTTDLEFSVRSEISGASQVPNRAKAPKCYICSSPLSKVVPKSDRCSLSLQVIVLPTLYMMDLHFQSCSIQLQSCSQLPIINLELIEVLKIFSFLAVFSHQFGPQLLGYPILSSSSWLPI